MKFRYKLDTGIEVKGFPGVIPFYYEKCACDHANYRFFHDWQELTNPQKAVIVAHYFAELLVNSVKDETVQSKIDADARRRNPS